MLAKAGGPLGLALATENDNFRLTPLARAINEVVLRAARREVQYVVIDAPVRHGKSTMISGYLPAAWLGVNPDDPVLLLGPTDAYAEEWGTFTRDLMEQHGEELYGVRVSRGTGSRKRWKLAGHEGVFRAQGVWSSLPGKGARAMVLDDLVRQPEEAFNPTARNKLWSRWDAIIRSRLAPDGVLFLVMSRWHQDDFAGRLMRELDESGTPYVRLHLPALAEADDPLGRAPGEPLCPQLGWTRDVLENRKRRTTFRIWTGQFQGTPTDEEGDFFKRSMFRYYEFSNGYFRLDPDQGGTRAIALRDCAVKQSVDLATTEEGQGKDPDYTVVLTYALNRRRGELYIVNVTRKRIGKPDLIPLLWEEWQQWLAREQRIESYGMQKSSVQDAIARGLPVEPVDKGRQSKEDVAEYTALRLKNGTIYWPRWAHWKEEFEAELLAYPAGHDDQVDALGYAALDVLTGKDQDDEAGGAYVASR